MSVLCCTQDERQCQIHCLKVRYGCMVALCGAHMRVTACVIRPHVKTTKRNACTNVRHSSHSHILGKLYDTVELLLFTHLARKDNKLLVNTPRRNWDLNMPIDLCCIQ